MDTWHNGRWSGARQAFSPNCEPRPAGETVELAVIHNISLPPFEYGTGAVEKLFTNNIDETEHPFYNVIKDLRVSSHFFITRTGAARRCVRARLRRCRQPDAACRSARRRTTGP